MEKDIAGQIAAANDIRLASLGLRFDKVVVALLAEVQSAARALCNIVLSGPQFIFILDELGPKLQAYIAGHPSLRGRLLFADAAPGTPEAAIHIMNDA